MSLTRRAALGAWYYGTLPWRRRAGRGGDAPVSILFYHRVADEHRNPWTITNRQFARQIRWLKDRFELISLEEVQHRVRAGDSPRPAVAITFDDGYAENCEHALPLLIKERIPVTYFVASQFVLEDKPFPHDVEAGRPLPVNTPEQIRALAKAGVEIGSHTRTHLDLGAEHDRQTIVSEVAGSGRDLAAIIDRPVRYFAFPYGQQRNLNAEAFRIAEEAGYEAVCSACGGYNYPAGDAFHLQRIHGDPLMLRLKNDATVDPRKAYRTMPFHYRPLTSVQACGEAAS
ncbi:MAG: polysaccharide deacetylase family protein [Planctomycetes bacterium]|nr:polysaccharide deacetylase family protein [Planctomycetota bacterium]